MKKFYLIFICLLFSTCIFCQKRVPKFYGIPIDGTKEEMIQKLVETGNFIKCIISGDKYDLMLIDEDFIRLGTPSFVKIYTQDSKVAVIHQDILHLTAENAKRLFNGAVEIFSYDSDLEKYGDSIPEKEDIFYEMRVNKKKYNVAAADKIDPLDFLTDLAEGLKPCEIENKYVFFMKGCHIEEMDEDGKFMIRLTLVNVRNAGQDFCSGNFGKIE